ncbi:hypothetical protein [Methanobacterium sp. ACI-7]|uniref:hypothetical protein n=1 Tax=unclassified Methanobacterium TaxID=2627676 RepID=UPI0039C42329
MKIEKLILGSIFILLLLLLCYNYAFEGYYQDNSVIDILNGYSDNQILIHGPITEINKDGFEVYNINNKNSYTVKTNLKLNIGTGIYVLGTLTSNNEVNVIKIMTFKQENVINVMFRSLLGLIIFLIVFLKFWKFELKKMLFVRLKENKACKSERFAASKFLILTVFLNHKILKKILRRK